jgi:predicted nucleic acid binding AN1-type Zn finger protein
MPRCAAEACNKKTMLTDMPCKCKNTHCSIHRMPESHGCSFDYKAEHKDNLLKYMSSAVVAKKVDII